jgi:hypothetical protein
LLQVGALALNASQLNTKYVLIACSPMIIGTILVIFAIWEIEEEEKKENYR